MKMKRIPNRLIANARDLRRAGFEVVRPDTFHMMKQTSELIRAATELRATLAAASGAGVAGLTLRDATSAERTS